MNELQCATPAQARIQARIDAIADLVPGCDAQLLLLHAMLKLVTAELNERMRSILREYEFHPVSFIALVMLINSNGAPLNPSDLSKITGESRANTTRICDDLVANGYLERRSNPEDRRRVDLLLAPAGIDAVRRLLPAIDAYVLTPLKSLSVPERGRFEGTLKQLLILSDPAAA